MPVTGTFPTEPVLPVGNCIELCFETDEFVVTEGMNIDLKLTGVSLEGQRGAITIFGCSFGFGNKLDSPTFINTQAPRTNIDIVQELLNRLVLKYEICSRFDVALSPDSGNTICITSNCFIEVESPYIVETPIDPDFIFTITGTNSGSLPTTKSGYRLFYQPFCAATKKPLSKKPFVAYFPYEKETGITNKIRVDVGRMLKGQVSASCPSKELDTPVVDEGATKEIYFLYGSQENEPEGCGVIFNQTAKSESIKLIAAACQCTEKDFSDYDGSTEDPVKFLNCCPDKLVLPKGACSWLKIFIDKKNFNEVCVIYSFFDGGVQGTIEKEIDIENCGVLDIPIYPEVLGNDITNVSVKVVLKQSGGGVQTDYSEVKTIRYVDASQCSGEIIYFKCSKGGYSPMPCFKVQTKETNNSQEEICKDVKCFPFKEKLKDGGRGIFNKKTFETQTLEATIEKGGDLNYVREFKASTHYFKIDNVNGEKCIRTFIIDTDGVIIYRAQGQLKVEITGRYGEIFNTL